MLVFLPRADRHIRTRAHVNGSFAQSNVLGIRKETFKENLLRNGVYSIILMKLETENFKYIELKSHCHVKHMNILYIILQAYSENKI